MSKYRILKEYENNLTVLMDILGKGSTDNLQLQSIGMYIFNSASNKTICRRLLQRQNASPEKQ